MHGAAGVHPLVKVMLETSRSAARHAARLGLTPASARRVYPQRRPGRPVGAVSAPDRRALPDPDESGGEQSGGGVDAVISSTSSRREGQIARPGAAAAGRAAEAVSSRPAPARA